MKTTVRPVLAGVDGESTHAYRKYTELRARPTSMRPPDLDEETAEHHQLLEDLRLRSVQRKFGTRHLGPLNQLLERGTDAHVC